MKARHGDDSPRGSLGHIRSEGEAMRFQEKGRDVGVEDEESKADGGVWRPFGRVALSIRCTEGDANTVARRPGAGRDEVVTRS